MNISITNNYQSERVEAQSSMRKKGQVTVPHDVRDVLKLREGDKVAFVIDKNKKVEMVKKPSVVARTKGALKSQKPILTAEALRVEAERSMAEEAIRRSAK